MATKKLPIFLVSFPDQHTACSTMMRFQEHYESPRFRGKVFTREDYEDWYATERGKFTYYEDWSGFNLPSRVLNAFKKGAFDPLTEKEKALLKLVGSRAKGDSYVIGCIKGDAQTLAHECVHGLFAIFPKYRKDVLVTIARHPTALLRKKLGRMGYHPDVFDDEINAYLLTGATNIFPLGTCKGPLYRELMETFERHFGYELDQAGYRRLTSKVQRLRYKAPSK
jgi:hypothetical protein